MVHYLHKLSAVFFYALGISFFVAYVLGLQGLVLGYWWMKIADLPLLASALVYGGTSLYMSVKPQEGPAPVLAWSIGVIVVCIFVFLAALNFWTLLS